jgi:hypothetical protein
MQHNLKLNNAAAETISTASADITTAVMALRRLLRDAGLPNTIDLMGYLGTITEAQYRIDTIVFEPSIALDSDYAIGEGNDPHGIVRPGDDIELERILDDEDAIVARKASAVTADDMLDLLNDGVIDMREFHNELDKRGIDQSHLCITPGCNQRVQFDDEPMCFTHSPDEGSSVRGYSHLMYARRAQQTADSCGENWVM